MLTSYYAGGVISLDQCFLFGSGLEFYRRNGVDLHLGSPVVDLDAAEHTLRTAEGNKLRYEKCLIATGASPILPEIPGIDSKHVYTLRTIEDASRLKDALERKPHRAIVVGASLVGIKVVELFVKAGVEVCLADRAEHIFPGTAHPDCARMIEKYLQQRGVALRLGSQVLSIEDVDNRVRVQFSGDGEAQEGNLVVICIGVKPNLGFLGLKQVRTAAGLTVDDYLETGIENIYAAGDVARGTNLLTGEKELIPLWANAKIQGRIAGRNMAGEMTAYPGSIPNTITHFLDVLFVGIGNPGAEGIIEEVRPGKEFTYRRTVRRDGRIVSVNLVNDVMEAGTLKHLMVKEHRRVAWKKT